MCLSGILFSSSNPKLCVSSTSWVPHTTHPSNLRSFVTFHLQLSSNPNIHIDLPEYLDFVILTDSNISARCKDISNQSNQHGTISRPGVSDPLPHCLHSALLRWQGKKPPTNHRNSRLTRPSGGLWSSCCGARDCEQGRGVSFQPISQSFTPSSTVMFRPQNTHSTFPPSIDLAPL